MVSALLSRVFLAKSRQMATILQTNFSNLFFNESPCVLFKFTGFSQCYNWPNRQQRLSDQLDTQWVDGKQWLKIIGSNIGIKQY